MVKTKRTVLILGGTGAMGNFLVDIFLNSNEWDVYVTSRSHHSSVLDNLTYFIGNAKDLNFIKEICTTKYDAIVDFMNYDYDEFLQNCNFLLNSCKHYIFLSSCRVYNNGSKLTEESDRLLDTIADKEFLSTQRYALRKARQEDILKSCDNKNWTIVRPYITYSNIRLQLGVYEKEEWLYRILNNKKLVIRKEILDCYTTLTYGFDVASGIYQIVNNNSLMEDTIQIVTEESITWREILEIYKQAGKDAIENAYIKAKAYYDVTGMPTIGMDNNLFIEELPDEKQPGTHVRRVNGKELTDDEMIEYYTNLVKEYGGKLSAKWVYGMVIYNGKTSQEYNWSKDNFYLVDKPSEKRNPGYPLDSISVIPESNKYFVELTKEEKSMNKQNYKDDKVVDFIINNI